MKKIILNILLATLLTSCSKENSKVIDEEVIPNKYIDISELMIDESLDASPGSLPLFESSSSSEITKTITLTNYNLSSPYSISSIKISEPSNGFKVKLNRCPSSLPSKKSCQISVSFSSRGLYDGDQHSSLEINNYSLQLDAVVSNQPNPDSSGTPLLNISLSSPFSPIGSSPIRTLLIKNMGDGTAKNVLTSVSSNYSIWINRCPTNLKPNASCSMDILYKNFRKGTPPPIDELVSVIADTLPSLLINLKTAQIDLGIVKLADSFPALSELSNTGSRSFSYTITQLFRPSKNVSVTQVILPLREHGISGQGVYLQIVPLGLDGYPNLSSVIGTSSVAVYEDDSSLTNLNSNLIAKAIFNFENPVSLNQNTTYGIAVKFVENDNTIDVFMVSPTFEPQLFNAPGFISYIPLWDDLGAGIAIQIYGK